MTRVLVIGATGMLGSMLVDWLQRDGDLELHATVRTREQAAALAARSPGVRIRELDALGGCAPEVLEGVAVAVNAVGLIKPFIRDDRRDEVARAIAVNSLFPLRLAEAAERTGTRVVQIATDCVFSGRSGPSDESAPHDATDVYGKSKSLGEVRSPRVSHLRCSIIGPEFGTSRSLLAWFLGQPRGAKLDGYRDHVWNGITTLHFARLVGALIRSGRPLEHVQHVVPGDEVSKARLLGAFASAYGRDDLAIRPVAAPVPIDRRLSTKNAAACAALWKDAGYPAAPTIEAMVHELATHAFPRARG